MPPAGGNLENATTIVAHDRPEAEIIEESISPLEEGEIEDVSEDDRPANSSQLIDGEDNIDKIIKEAYQDLPKVSTKVISTLPETSVQEFESHHNGPLRKLKRKEEYARQQSPNKFQSTSRGSQSRDIYRRTRPDADPRFDRWHDDQMTRNYRQELSDEAISERYSKASDRVANKDIDERYDVLSPPPPAPLLPQMIPMPQAIQQQNYYKPTKSPLLPTPNVLKITMPGNPQTSYTSGANPIPPPQPRPSAQLYPAYQLPYGVPPYPLQAYPMQSTSQVSPYEYFAYNLPAPTLKQPQLSQTGAHSSWSLEVENFLSKKPAVQPTDNYEEVGMDLASPVSTVNVEEAEVVNEQSDQPTKQHNEDDDLEKLRKALLEQQQQKTKTSGRQVVLSRDCSPISSRERKDRSADKHSRKSRSSTSRQLKELKKELADVRGSIDDSEKKMKEYSHRYENLKKELQRTLNAIRTEQKNFKEHHERQMELTLKCEMMEINLKQSELTKKRRDKSLEQDCADELAVTNEIIRRCRNTDEKLRTKENNLALLTATPQPTPPLEESGREEGRVSEKKVMETSRKRSNVEKEAPVKPKMTRNGPEVVAPKPMVAFSSSSAETTLGENRAKERPMSQPPQISSTKALTTALVPKAIVRKENPRSFPHKSAHLYAFANDYFPPTLPEPGYITRTECYKLTEVRTAGAYGIGLRAPPGIKQVPEQSTNEPIVNAQSVEKVITPVQQKTTTQQVQVVVVNQETEDCSFSQTSNEENNDDAIELLPNSQQRSPEESEHQMDENEVLDEVALRQKLLAKINPEKRIAESAQGAPLSRNGIIDKGWESESPNIYGDKTGSDWKNDTRGRLEDGLIPPDFEAWAVTSNESVTVMVERAPRLYDGLLRAEGASQVVYEPRSPSYDMDDEPTRENPMVVKPMQQEGIVNEPVSRNDDVAASYDYSPQSPDYVPESYVYEPMSPNYGIDDAENEVTSQPLNNIDKRDSISQRENGVEAPASRGQVEPNATLKKKSNLRRRSRCVEEEPVEIPSTSVNRPKPPFNVNVPLCSSELLYGTCLEANCRMQHFGNTASAHSEPAQPKKPQEKPKKRVIVPRVYHGENAMVAEFVRGVFAKMPKEYPVGYIEAGIAAMIRRWEAEKDRGNTFEKFKPTITKLIDQVIKKQQKDGPTQKGPTAEKHAILNKDPKLGVPDYVSRFNF